MDTQIKYCKDPLSSLISLESTDLLSQLLFSEHEIRDDQFLSTSPSPAEKPSSSTSFHNKSNHNARERNRRKKLSELYSSLRTLLPETDTNKKMSTAMTVSLVIKYIQELEKKVAMLTKRKEHILLNSLAMKEGILNDQCVGGSPVISANCLSGKEIMVHICVLNKKSNNTVPLSKYLDVLEREGLKLIDASTSSSCTYAERIFYDLHFEVLQGRGGLQGELLCDHLIKSVIQKTGM